MTTFTIHEAGGWWYPIIQIANRQPRTLPRQVGILEASLYVTSIWRTARYEGLR